MLNTAGHVVPDIVGHPLGIAVGAEFHGRAELCALGVHLPQMHGIGKVDLVAPARSAPVGGPQAVAAAAAASAAFPLATSIVDSGGYSTPAADGGAVLEYRGEGGRDPKSNRLSTSQKLTKVRAGGAGASKL